MPRQSGSHSVSRFSCLEELRPELYTAPDECVAMVFNAEEGSALLTSQFGSTITACPLRKNVASDPQEVSRKYLLARGFKRVLLPIQGWKEQLRSVITAAGFTSQHVEQALALCNR